MSIPHPILDLMNQNSCMMKLNAHCTKVRNTGRGADKIVRKAMSLVKLIS